MTTNNKTMKAYRIHEFGSIDQLKIEEIPVPRPGKGEILVRVVATSINPVDWWIMEGLLKDEFPVNFPFTPGWDVSGIVELIGEGVTSFSISDEVYSRPNPTQNGAYAEYIVLDAAQVSLKPKSLSHLESASIPLAGLTAWQGLLKHGMLTSGQTVLIHAGSGGVGTFAIQFAKLAGAKVIVTTSDENIELVKSLGADTVINYKTERFEKIVKDIDLVLDTLGEDTQLRSMEVVKSGGRVITTVKPMYQKEAASKNIHFQGFIAESLPEDLLKIADLIDEGKVHPVITKILRFDQIKDAEKESKEGHVSGKMVVQVTQE